MNSLPSQNDSSTRPRRTILAGLLCRRERWVLSGRGWLALFAVLLGLVLTFGFGVHPFLTVTERVPADLLVVEGWSPARTMRQAASEFLQDGYTHMVLIRPVLETGDQYETGRYSGDYMSRILLADGVPTNQLTTLFPNVAQKDRTYHSALTVKQWAQEHGMNVKSLDVATVGPHSRRSRLMYQKAFGSGIKIGVIAMDDHEYDPRRWWRTSEGVREVIGESIAYLYARLIFHPPDPAAGTVK